MRKTLLIAASAMAASIISSQAGVYSQNIVGYVNNPLGAGFSLQANPLDNGIGNNLTNLINDTTGTYDGSFIYVWQGTSYKIYQFDSSQPTLVANATDSGPLPGPALPPGTAWFFNSDAPSNTVTYVGTVSVQAAATGSQAVGTTSNTISGSQILSLVSSVLPIGGGVQSVLQLSNTAPNYVLDGSFVYIPNINAAGTLLGYNIVQYDHTFPSGFANATDSAGVAEPQIPVGTGFFFNNQTGGAVVWVQSL
jgi:hypothetical protein